MSTCLVHITLFACIFISARNLFQYDKRKLLVNTKYYVRGKKNGQTFLMLLFVRQTKCFGNI